MRKSTTIPASRRQVLRGAASALGIGLAGWPLAARAQAKGKVVVGTWGGDYARLLNKNIEQPILSKNGWEVIQDQAGDPERRSKMLAERRLPRGSTDLQGLSALNMFQMHDAGVIDVVDYTKLTNAPNLLPAMKYPYGVGHIYSGKVGVRRAQELPGHFRSQARQQARHHRYPIPVHAGLCRPGGRRQGQRLAGRQETAARMQEGRRPHLSHQ